MPRNKTRSAIAHCGGAGHVCVAAGPEVVFEELMHAGEFAVFVFVGD